MSSETYRTGVSFFSYDYGPKFVPYRSDSCFDFIPSFNRKSEPERVFPIVFWVINIGYMGNKSEKKNWSHEKIVGMKLVSTREKMSLSKVLM